MAVGDLSDPASIERAMVEFDALGREGFLAKYGFGKAYRYLLVSNGREYDAKAIIGAAHGYQFPHEGPLKNTDFASSEHTVKRTLENLGFEVKTIERQEQPQAWVVRAGESNKYADDFEVHRRIAIGFHAFGDVTGLTARDISDRAQKAFTDKTPAAVGSRVGVVRSFAIDIKVGELILTPTKNRDEVLVGRVTSSYEYLPEPVIGTFRHNRTIEWLGRFARTSFPEETQKTLDGPLSVYKAGASDELYAMFGSETPSKRSWIFQGNPKIFDVRGAVKARSRQDWVVRQHGAEVGPGDRVYIWEAGPESGVVGIGEVKDEVRERPGITDEFIRDHEALGTVEPRVTVGDVSALRSTLSRADIKETPGLETLHILKQAAGTNFRVTPEEDAILWRLISPLLSGNVDPLGPPKWTNAWWVNQGSTFKEESDGGYVWAPNTSKGGGAPKKHWQALEGMKVGDLIFHYARTAIRAASRVTAVAQVTNRPSELPLTEWEGQGWKVKTDYFHLDEPIALSEIPVESRLAERGAFDVNGSVTQQYANHLSEHFTKLLIDQFGDRIRNAISSTAKKEGSAVEVENEKTLVDLIERRMNVVFYGPPGTGKTFTALDLAQGWEETYGPGSVRKVTFHPSYGYEDFVQGFRPKEDQPGEFALQPGILLRICDDAHKEPDRNFLLFIDEINRGDVARVFGELITYIERDKRGVPFDLAQDATAQYEIPGNLYILGTMNTADKSVSLLDVALRRRFAFVEFRADPDAYARVPEWREEVNGLDLGQLLEALNQRLIGEGIEVDRAIGHALLGISTDAANPLNELRERIEYDIVPLVAEYSYLDRQRIGRILPGLVDDQGRFRDELTNDQLPGELRALISGAAITAPPPVLEAGEFPELEAEAMQTELEE